MPTPIEESAERLANLYDTGVRGDLYITTSSYSYLVHKAVVFNRGEGLEKLPTQPKSERPRTAPIDCINLSRQNPVAICAMIRYFYFFDYDLNTLFYPKSRLCSGLKDQKPAIGEQVHAAHHASVFLLARECNISGLEKLARTKFGTNLIDLINTQNCVALVDASHRAHGLKHLGHDGLWDAFLVAISDNLDIVWEMGYDNIKPIYELKDFSLDLMKCQADKLKATRVRPGLF